jgi:hypothetical protein
MRWGAKVSGTLEAVELIEYMSSEAIHASAIVFNLINVVNFIYIAVVYLGLNEL